jgi:hypothetical protein
MCFCAHISQHNVKNHLPYRIARRRERKREREICMRNYWGDAAEEMERRVVDNVMDMSNFLIQELIASSFQISVFLHSA